MCPGSNGYTSLHPLPERRHEGLEREHPVVVVVHVLAHLVDDEEQRPPRAALVHHLLDRLHRLVRGPLALEARPRAAVHPRHRVREKVRLERVQRRGEVILHELAVLELAPGLSVHREHLVHERGVQPLELQLQLVVGDEVAGPGVVEPVLQLPHHDGVDVLVVPRLAADVEDDRDRLDPAHQALPGGAQIGRAGGVILGEQRLGERLPAGEFPAVEREPQELREARLAGAVKAGDPARGQLRSPGLLELAVHRGQEANELLVDPPLCRARVAGRVAARDDVFLYLALQLGRLLLVKIHDRRDGAGDFFLEQVSNQHRVTGRSVGGSRGRPGARP